MTILEKIVEQKKIEIAGLKPDMMTVHKRNFVRPSFRKNIHGNEIRIIAEIKKASPSRGILIEDFHPVRLAESYFNGGASALSVLTDEKFFQGHLQFLDDVSALNLLPTLRKDFIIDSRQIEEAYIHGASAVLLIAAILNDEQLHSLYRLAQMLKLDVLVEVHDKQELTRVLRLDNPIIGVNNRNLHTFETSLENAIELVKFIPSDLTKVTESGIFTCEDMIRMEDAGYHAALIGESIVKSGNPGAKLKELLGQ